MKKLAEMSNEGRRSGRRKKCYLEVYETRSDGEVARDDAQFQRHLEEETAKLRAKMRVSRRLHHSFDVEVLRELHDDFGVEDDFQSQLSWTSYPPQNPDLVYRNAYYLAKVSFFSQKIKPKFQYNNMGREVYPVVVPTPKASMKGCKT